MIQYIVVIGTLMVGISDALAEEHLLWPQSDAFYNGQVEQKYRTVEPSAGGQVASPSVAYTPPQSVYAAPAYPSSPYYGQYPYAPNVAGSYMPAPPMQGGYMMPNYMPSGSNFLPFGMGNPSGMMPPVPTSFSFPNPSNTMNGFSFPGFPSFGNSMFNPFGR